MTTLRPVHEFGPDCPNYPHGCLICQPLPKAAAPGGFDVRVEWHAPDVAFAAVFLRDGQPWFLDGALVGMAGSRGGAVDDLVGIARHLVTHGENFLTDMPLSLPDREWLFGLLDAGPDPHDEMYSAIRQAREAAAPAT
jgi:hypothetical protein